MVQTSKVDLPKFRIVRLRLLESIRDFDCVDDDPHTRVMYFDLIDLAS